MDEGQDRDSHRLRCALLAAKNHIALALAVLRYTALPWILSSSAAIPFLTQQGEMEKMFGPAYTGDPGVPHSDKEAFSTIFWGSVAFSAYSIVCPYYWEQCNNMFNWHDLAMVHENHHMKRAIKQGKPYEFKWNKIMNKTQREAYYHNWADYFP